jgi:endogenous inhibitor of DNA gyrase (YacG/DUF329 family)
MAEPSLIVDSNDDEAFASARRGYWTPMGEQNLRHLQMLPCSEEDTTSATKQSPRSTNAEAHPRKAELDSPRAGFQTPPAMAKCVVCEKEAALRASNAFFPFCSKHCKWIDLGRWVGEGYVIPGRSQTMSAALDLFSDGSYLHTDEEER